MKKPLQKILLSALPLCCWLCMGAVFATTNSVDTSAVLDLTTPENKDFDLTDCHLRVEKKETNYLLINKNKSIKIPKNAIEILPNKVFYRIFLKGQYFNVPASSVDIQMTESGGLENLTMNVYKFTQNQFLLKIKKNNVDNLIKKFENLNYKIIIDYLGSDNLIVISNDENLIKVAAYGYASHFKKFSRENNLIIEHICNI
ncbi:MAG: hypothetical protein QM533_13305 [Cytophagales bacterium]|nr:hypothetical protein [Cytophagales bacterium]